MVSVSHEESLMSDWSFTLSGVWVSALRPTLSPSYATMVQKYQSLSSLSGDGTELNPSVWLFARLEIPCDSKGDLPGGD